MSGACALVSRVVPASERPLTWRLDNWGARMSPRYEPGEAGSAERSWVSPQRNHFDYTATIVIPEPVPGSGADAVEIDQAVACLSLRYDFMLRAHYVWRSAPDAMMRFAKKLGFRRPRMDDVEAALAMGRALLVRQLEIPAVIRKARQREWIDRRIELEKLRRQADAD